MILSLYLIALAAAGAFFYALRGGAINLGSTQLARLIWAIPCGAVAAGLVLIGVMTGTAAAALTFVGLLLGHAAYQHMGTVDWNGPYAPKDGQNTEVYAPWLPGTTYWNCALGLWIVGGIRGFLVALAFVDPIFAVDTLTLTIPYQPFLLVPAWAFAHTLAYMVGWAIPMSERFHSQWRLHICEALFGAMALPALWWIAGMPMPF